MALDTGKKTILIVDDSMLNRTLLADIVEGEYNVVEAEDGEAAVVQLQKLGTGISLVLLDYVMPRMNGFDVLRVMNEKRWIADIPVIMVSSENDPTYVERAYDLGVTDFISRPYDVNIVQRRVVNTLALYQKQRVLAGMVADQVNERERMNDLMVAILSHIVEFRNTESGTHVLDVRKMTELILMQLVHSGNRYELTMEDVSIITTASSLHDIGKISIPESILNKPGRLTSEEFEVMKTHTVIGAEMLDNLGAYADEELVRVAHDICRWHHERWDGRGYPDGLKGDDIPIAAQVVSLADVYDALTGSRVYKPAFSHKQAMRMIHNGECGTFNPLLLECLAAVSSDLKKCIGNHGAVGREVSGDALLKKVSTGGTGAVQPSSRMLELLDYERIKYRFFASMSKEVQYEYTADPSMIVLSDWGERRLGLPEMIMDPFNDRAFLDVFGEENVRAFNSLLRATTAANPVVSMDMEVRVDGKTRWLHVLARALWSEDIRPVYLGCIGKAIDIDDRRAELLELQSKAYRDSLTGVSNRAFAQKAITELLGEGRWDRIDDCYVLALCDLDFFKQANDVRGHQFGDLVLQQFAARLCDNVRDQDIVARLGGDEFLLFIKCSADVRSLIARIHRSLEEELDGFSLSVSMGVAVTQGEIRDYDRLLRRADIALYHTKRNGRAGYTFYDDLSEEEAESLFRGAVSVLSDIDSEDVRQ